MTMYQQKEEHCDKNTDELNDDDEVKKVNSFPYSTIKAATKLDATSSSTPGSFPEPTNHLHRDQHVCRIRNPDLSISVPIDQVDNELFIITFVKYRHGADKTVRICSG
jgi:hypothetical protein